MCDKRRPWKAGGESAVLVSAVRSKWVRGPDSPKPGTTKVGLAWLALDLWREVMVVEWDLLTG